MNKLMQFLTGSRVCHCGQVFKPTEKRDEVCYAYYERQYAKAHNQSRLLNCSIHLNEAIKQRLEIAELTGAYPRSYRLFKQAEADEIAKNQVNAAIKAMDFTCGGSKKKARK